ncbi:hypothetical protein FRC09_014507 [Ceratobasidium sp. 395]|nr:hypothetical protein FRC09_014507 [Ceratobasidium sp. 395]
MREDPRSSSGIIPSSLDASKQIDVNITTDYLLHHQTIEEIIPRLNERGCLDLAKELKSYSKAPVSRGGFGDIHTGQLRDGTIVAIKLIRVFANSEQKIQKHLKHAAQELYTWSKCRHQNVQPLLGLIELRGQLGMVSAWEKYGNVKNYLKLKPDADPCEL